MALRSSFDMRWWLGLVRPTWDIGVFAVSLLLWGSTWVLLLEVLIDGDAYDAVVSTVLANEPGTLVIGVPSVTYAIASMKTLRTERARTGRRALLEVYEGDQVHAIEDLADVFALSAQEVTDVLEDERSDVGQVASGLWLPHSIVETRQEVLLAQVEAEGTLSLDKAAEHLDLPGASPPPACPAVSPRCRGERDLVGRGVAKCPCCDSEIYLSRVA